MKIEHWICISKGAEFTLYVKKKSGRKIEVSGVALKDLKISIKEDKTSFLGKVFTKCVLAREPLSESLDFYGLVRASAKKGCAS